MELDLKDKKIWKNCPKGRCPWNKFMELDPEYCNGFVRFNCINTEDGYKTAGIQTVDPLGDGVVEIKARFHNGESGWPALWLFNEYSKEYYEIDISEYFDDSKKVMSGLFMPKHMSSKFWRFFRPKEHTKIKKDDWNIFACEWDEKHIRIAINGKVIINYKNNGSWKSFPQTENDRKFTLILSMQYCHGTPKPEELPLWMDVEYVRYFKIGS